MAKLSIYSGLVSPGEMQILMAPKILPKTRKTGIMYVHGAGSGADHAVTEYGKQCVRTQMIADAGYTAISADFGGPQTWGNDTALNSMTTTYNYLQTLPGVAPGKIALIGSSMGGLGSLAWAAAHPTLVSCILLTIPVINPTDIQTNNRLGYASFINGAYGGAWSEATYGAAHNPLTMAQAGKYNGIPMLIFYGALDQLCLPVHTQSFATAVGASVTLAPLSGGHEELTYNLVDYPRSLQFLKDTSV